MTAPLVTASRDALVAAMGAHHLHASMNYCTGCHWRPTPGAGSLADQHRRHVAEALLESGVVRVVDEVRAEALTEAANEWTQGAWADTPRRADRIADRIAGAQYAGDWLRARAAALTEETP